MMNRRPIRPRKNPRPAAGPMLPTSHNDCVLRTRPLSLVTPEGVIPLAKIGQGMFAAVYRETMGKQRVFSVVDENVYDKEIAAMVNDEDSRNPHLPRVERFGMLTDNRSVFTMPFYTVPYRVANANPASRAAFTALRKCISGIFPVSGRKERGYEIATRKLECIEAAGAKIPPKLADAVRLLVDMSTNYGDQYDLEFSPRNVATDDQGNLVLLDVLFNRDNVDRVMKAKMRKATASRW
jgi:hypothetical protein